MVYLFVIKVENLDPGRMRQIETVVKFLNEKFHGGTNSITNLIREDETERAWKRCLGLWRDLVKRTFTMRTHPKTNPTSMHGMEATKRILSSTWMCMLAMHSNKQGRSGGSVFWLDIKWMKTCRLWSKERNYKVEMTPVPLLTSESMRTDWEAESVLT